MNNLSSPQASHIYIGDLIQFLCSLLLPSPSIRYRSHHFTSFTLSSVVEILCIFALLLHSKPGIKIWVWTGSILSSSSPGADFYFKKAHTELPAGGKGLLPWCQTVHTYHLKTNLLTDFWTVSCWWVSYRFAMLWSLTLKKDVKYLISLHPTGHDSFWLWTAQLFSDPPRSPTPLRHPATS